MEYVYIKLEDDEYFKLDRDKYRDYNIFFITGGRGVGKSYDVKHEIVDLLVKDKDATFIYMRTKSEHLKTVNSWLAEAPLSKISGCPENVIERGKPYGGAILLKGYNHDGELEYKRVIGHCFSLETSATEKSAWFGSAQGIVFEEYQQYNLSQSDQEKFLLNFIEAVESVARQRIFNIYLIANSFNSYSIIESTFKDNPRAIKFKVKKSRKESQGLLSGIDKKFVNYLEGEVFNDYTVDPFDFKDLVNIKIGGKILNIKYNRNFEKSVYLSFNKTKKYIDKHNYFDQKSLLTVARDWTKFKFYFKDANVDRFFGQYAVDIHRRLKEIYLEYFE